MFAWVVIGVNLISLICILLFKMKIDFSLIKNWILKRKIIDILIKFINCFFKKRKIKKLINKITWDNWIKLLFWVIVIFDLSTVASFATNIMTIASLVDDHNGLVAYLLINLLFVIDLFYIENNYSKTNIKFKHPNKRKARTIRIQKKINRFFIILIISLILSIILVFIITPNFSLNMKFTAAIELFKLVIDSTLLGIVINVIQNSDELTIKSSILYVAALIVIFVSYGIFSTIEQFMS